MSLFEPLTLGYDWEVWALNQQMLPADAKKFQPIAERVNSEVAPVEAHREWRFIEAGAGIVREWPELLDRTMRYHEWVRAEFAKEDLVFYPCGTIVAERGTAGLHVHVGTAADASAEAHVTNAFASYLPALAALMVNSPVSNWMRGKHKAYRMSGYDWGSGGVYSITSPHLMIAGWEGDVSWRRNWKPTIEVRLADSPLSPRLLCEYALVVAGLLDWISNHADAEQKSYTPEQYEEVLANRWRATVDGLQAIFTIDGREVPAPEAVAEIIDRAGPGMRRLGASEEDLVVIPEMLAKRQTQADLQLAYISRFDDLPAFERSFAQVAAEPTAFEQYLEIAPVLPEAGCRDHDEALLEFIGTDTQAEHLRNRLMLPPVILETKLRRLAERGLIRIDVTPEDGITCTRMDRVPSQSRRASELKTSHQ